MSRAQNNEFDEIDNSQSKPSRPVGSQCSHTMKRKDRDGVIYCCDCGKLLSAANR